MTYLECQKVLQEVSRSAWEEIQARGLNVVSLKIDDLSGEQLLAIELEAGAQAVLLSSAQVWQTGLAAWPCFLLGWRVQQALEFVCFALEPSAEMSPNHVIQRSDNPALLLWLLTDYWDHAGRYRSAASCFSPKPSA